jgi:small-conductance mechanosensitive channel
MLPHKQLLGAWILANTDIPGWLTWVLALLIFLPIYLLWWGGRKLWHTNSVFYKVIGGFLCSLATLLIGVRTLWLTLILLNS